MRLNFFARNAATNQTFAATTGPNPRGPTGRTPRLNSGSLPPRGAATREDNHATSGTQASRRPTPRAFIYALQDPNERTDVGNCCFGASSAHGTTKINACCLGIRNEPDKAVISCCWIPCFRIRD